ncbi:MAG: hypothetical protein IJY89_01605, partial [Clostridia bacterium]|nr:hypothetical protein [Clostridia bacterium]
SVSTYTAFTYQFLDYIAFTNVFAVTQNSGKGYWAVTLNGKYTKEDFLRHNGGWGSNAMYETIAEYTYTRYGDVLQTNIKEVDTLTSQFTESSETWEYEYMTLAEYRAKEKYKQIPSL